MNSTDVRPELTEPRRPAERLLTVVRRILGPSAATTPLPIDARFSELGLNSIKMVSLMLAIEAEFDVVIPQEEITPESFASIASVAAMLERVRDAAEPEPDPPFPGP